MASPKDFTYKPVDTIKSHVFGTYNILEIAKKYNSKVLYISTVEIYGDWSSKNSIKEDDMGPILCNNSRSSYPVSKRLCESMLSSFIEQYNIEFVSIRMSHTIGPGISLNDGRAFAEFISTVLNNKDIILHSDGSAKRTYTYITDAVSAMLIAFISGKENFYNVANTENILSIKELAQLIIDISNKKNLKVIIKSNNSKFNYLNFDLGMMDNTKIKELGWKPRVNAYETFQRTIKSIK